MSITSILWDEWNEPHILRHGILREEVEAICRSHPLVMRGRQGYHLLYGQIMEGHYILVVIKRLSGGAVRPVTARDMTKTERQLFQRRH